MQPIRISRNSPELKDQLDFLIKQEFKVVYSKYRKLPYFLIGWTLLIILLIYLPDSSYLIGLKGVLTFLTGLVWVGVLLFLLTIIIRKYKRIAWRDKTIEYCSQNDMEGLVSFDNEKITVVTNTYKTELKWEYYSGYALDKGSLFIFPGANLYEALYFSQAEIGAEHFETLKSIVKEKLEQVPG